MVIIQIKMVTIQINMVTIQINMVNIQINMVTHIKVSESERSEPTRDALGEAQSQGVNRELYSAFETETETTETKRPVLLIVSI